jgi:predicted RNA-binding Zn ribbon-like protein
LLREDPREWKTSPIEHPLAHFPFMSEPASRKFDLSGGHIALDFVNTLSDRLGEKKERIPNYAALLFWSEQAGVLPHYRIHGLLEQSLRTPGQAVTVLQDAIGLREALFEIFSAVVGRRVVPGKALGKLNMALMEGASFVRLAQNERRFEWDWAGSNPRLNAMLWPVARAAADLLVSEDVAKLRVCASEDCAWLFLDQTRNARRRWCDMKTCGNRVKARRHYERVKAQ